jgi:hypothetical protein
MPKKMPLPENDDSTTCAVDYRSCTPWDFGLAPAALRLVAACTRAQIAQAQHWPAPVPVV